MSPESGQTRAGAATEPSEEPRPALVCRPASQVAAVQTALQELGYVVTVPAKPEDALGVTGAGGR